MKTFVLKKEHLELLKHVVWRNSGYEYDAPEIDSKRPFGNSSLFPDMIEILDNNPDVCPHCDEKISRKYTSDDLCALFNDLKIALEVILTSQSFDLGEYLYNDKLCRWVYYGKKEE